MPLPEVGEYTDMITVGALGLPVGFDESALVLNVGGMLRLNAMAGLGKVTIVGEQGEPTKFSADIGSVSGDAIALRGIRVAKKAPLYNQQPSYDDPEYGNVGVFAQYSQRSAILSLNTTANTESIRADGTKKWPRSELEPAAQARYMNQGLKAAIIHEAVESFTSDQIDAGIIGSVLGLIYTAGALTGGPGFGVYGVFCGTAAYQVLAEVEHRFRKHHHPDTPPRIRSILPQVHPDRIVATYALARMTRLMKSTATTGKLPKSD